MRSLSVPLANGYRLDLNAFDDERKIDIVTAEADGTVNQPLVTVEADETGERLSIAVYGINEDAPIFSVKMNMHHDPANEPEDEADDEADDDPDTDYYEGIGPGDTGDAVKTIQRRLKELGWFNGNIGGNYLTLTTEAVKAFQLAAGLQVDGVCDIVTINTMMSEKAPRKTVDATSSAMPASGKAIEKDWWKSDIQQIFAKGVVATITDVETGLAWREKRRGGVNHADVQPLTAADTAALKKAYGGKWSWDRRAIFVTINGINYAASMNGMPHGGSSIPDNNFDGHHCIHFTNSRTHCSDKVCPNHQKAIKKALAATL